MTNREENNWSDDLPVDRRDVLRIVGAAGALGAVGAGNATAQPPKEHIVGVENGHADEAKRRAESTRKTIDFGRKIGQAVVGRWSENARRGLRNNRHVRYIEENGTMTPHSHDAEVQWGVDRIDAEIAHHASDTGSGTDIAVLDTGIDADHPDLQANLGDGHSPLDCQDGFHPDGSCDEDWDDDDGHGTHVAGIANAVGNNSDVVGVSTEATLHAVKVCQQSRDSDGNVVTGCPFSEVADGINTVVDEGYDVINMSLGACCPSCDTVGDGNGDCDSCPDTGSTMSDAIERAEDNGVVVIASAGNDGNRPDCDGDGDRVCGDDDCVSTPANHDDVIAVSSTTEVDTLSGFSSVGPEVDIAAPGTAIPSTWNDGGTRSISGTSMAAPHVAGAAAQLIADGTSPANVESELEGAAEDIGLDAVEQGSGLLDVANALGHDSANDLTEVLTSFASSIGYTEATLVGRVTALTGNDDAEVFFEYREAATSSWTRSATEPVTSTGRFEIDVTDLQQNTSYEFRAGITVTESSEGWSSTERGDVESFSTVNNPDPIASFTRDPQVPDPGDMVMFDASGSDPGEAFGVDEDDSIVSYEWDFENDGTFDDSGVTATHTYDEPGDVTVRLRVTDEFGQTDETTTTLRVNEAPEAAFDHSPTVPNEGQDVQFDASDSTDPDGTIDSYQWDFGDGTTQTTSDPGIDYNYGPAGEGNWGEFTVSLTVVDNDGAMDDTTATVRVNAYPRADFEVVTDPPVRNEPVEFDASNSEDPNSEGEIVEYAWDFGDGTTESQTDPVVQHSFATGGEHTVTLRVTDDDGASDDDLSVHEETLTVRIRVPIEISPGGDEQNSINPNRNGNVAVAVMTGPEFDSPARLDHSSVHFGDPDDVSFDTSSDPFSPEGGATPAHAGGHVEDIDGDGDMDSLFHFPSRDAGFDSNDSEGKLVGLTNDDVPVFGTDSVTLVGGGRP